MSDPTRTTVHVLANTLNASPDMTVLVYGPGGEGLLYDGRYDEIPEDLLHRYVDQASITRTETTYRTYIPHMNLYLTPGR